MGRSIPPRYDPYKSKNKKKRHRPPKRRFKPHVKQKASKFERKILKLVKEILAKG